jgi:hypothetical protein
MALLVEGGMQCIANRMPRLSKTPRYDCIQKTIPPATSMVEPVTHAASSDTA